MVKPPVPGDPSYEQYSREIHSIQESLKRKAKLVSKRLNDIPGMSCNAVQGAMYAYPRITVPEKALHHAKVHIHVCGGDGPALCTYVCNILWTD